MELRRRVQQKARLRFSLEKAATQGSLCLGGFCLSTMGGSDESVAKLFKVKRIQKNAGKVTFEQIWEGLGKQIWLLNHAKIRCILLVWVSLDVSWERIRRQV